VTVQEEKAEIEASAFRPNFEAFYRQELHSVIGLAYVLSGSRSGAEDLAQEAFLAALRHWSDVGRYEDPGGWVRRVVANRAVSSFRRRAAEARALAQPDRRRPPQRGPHRLLLDQ
jgi:DNA-directed RNA polymerase specialized sigma24 family protein